MVSHTFHAMSRCMLQVCCKDELHAHHVHAWSVTRYRHAVAAEGLAAEGLVRTAILTVSNMLARQQKH